MNSVLRVTRYVALCLISWSPIALSYEFTGARWHIAEGDAVDYYASRGLCAGQVNVSEDACLEAIKMGYDVWSDLTCAFMQWNYKGRTETTS